MVTGRHVKFAVTQFACSPNPAENVAIAERLVREAAANGANVILLQELFETLYFCQDIQDYFTLAHPVENNPLLNHFSDLAKELAVVLPISFFERSGQCYFNSLVVFDSDGQNLGLYRKAHIPQSPGYFEKFYFSEGDTGFKVFKTSAGALGVAICWDQWFPETARILAMMGAEMICYPTAIGSEPQDPGIDSQGHWQRVMQGHAAANAVPVMASNRIGIEESSGTVRLDSPAITFYGSSFITDHLGNIIKQASRTEFVWCFYSCILPRNSDLFILL